VHKKMIVACLDKGGSRERREFGTTTSAIKELANWLTISGCKMIVNEILSSDEVSHMIHGRMRPKLEQLMDAIEGITTPLQRRLLAQIIDHIDDLNRRVAILDEMVKGYMAE